MVAAPFDRPEARLAGLPVDIRERPACQARGVPQRAGSPIAVPAVARPRRLRVTVAGGGPVGLAFALSLNDLLGASVDLTVHDGRWTDRSGSLAWKGEGEGNRRRDQVVTLQSGVCRDLPRTVERALFGSGDYSVVWPHGRNSPREYGRPRNIRIRDVEDRLLDLARVSKIRLIPERYEPRGRELGCDVLAICDGAASPTRERFTTAFGMPDPTPYLVDGRLAEDMILSLGVTTTIDPTLAVVLTVAQSRFLLNAHRGRGVLNVRLTREEASELAMIDLDGRKAAKCFPVCGCALSRVEFAPGRGAYVCARHRTTLKAALEPASPLWRRVREGLRMFDIAATDVHAVTVFCSSMMQRSRFTAELVPPGNAGGGTFGFLLGDASGPIHVWPGRGLNHGLSTGVSLARCLKEKWRGGLLRHADFARHEANMHMLQYRHKDRAWRAMVRFGEDGRARLIADLMQDALHRPLPRRRDMVAVFIDRLMSVTTRLAGRIETLPGESALRSRLEAMSDETLAMLVGSGAWETLASGGEEVDVTRLFREGAAPEPATGPVPPWGGAVCREPQAAAVA